MYTIEIHSQTEVDEQWIALMKTAVSATLTHENIAPPAELTLVLAEDGYLHQLNSQFRHIDRPTDILSFPADDIAAQHGYLGDIAISVPYAARHAAQDGHTLAEELQLLAVHGTLHLLGYNDEEEMAKKEMWEAQSAILKTLNLNLNI